VNHLPDNLFDTVESAHEYVKLLAEVVSAAKQDLEADINRENGPKFPRRLDAIRLASYNLSKLELHMATSSRILNDLRSLRRLLFEERNANVMAAQLAVSTKPSGTVLDVATDVRQWLSTMSGNR
jgi:hypothetical protein